MSARLLNGGSEGTNPGTLQKVSTFVFGIRPPRCRSGAASPLTAAVGGWTIAGPVGLGISLITRMQLEPAMVDEILRQNC